MIQLMQRKESQEAARDHSYWTLKIPKLLVNPRHKKIHKKGYN